MNIQFSLLLPCHFLKFIFLLYFLIFWYFQPLCISVVETPVPLLNIEKLDNRN